MIRPAIIFAAGLFLVTLAGAFDLWLLVALRDSFERLPATELNPIGRWLIVIGGVQLFASVKFFCTVLALCGIVTLRPYVRPLVDRGVAIVALLYWLILAWMVA